jgi:hypothetical protein
MNIPISVPWLADLLPEGFPARRPIVITGPGGSGKPLIGDAFIASWLASGGSVVFLSLQYPQPTFLYESYRRVIGEDLSACDSRLAFVELDTTIDGLGPTTGNRFAANVVYPEVLRDAVARGADIASSGAPADGPGVMLFASALNLLMFSPTWGRAITDEFVAMMGEGELTTLFSVSEKPHAELVKKIEGAADILLYSQRPGDELSLVMNVRRADNLRFVPDPISIPIPEDELRATREIAERSRSKVIPEISAI